MPEAVSEAGNDTPHWPCTCVEIRTEANKPRIGDTGEPGNFMATLSGRDKW
jgi:hypothetical protein